jgi:hypothetical protein
MTIPTTIPSPLHRLPATKTNEEAMPIGQHQQSIAEQLEAWMKEKENGITLSMDVLCSMLSDTDTAITKAALEGMDEIVLPEPKWRTLQNLPASRTVLFRRASIDESVEALRNEYLR